VISEQRERWLADGSPAVPTLVVAGTPHVLQHPSQAPALLGLEAPPELRDAPRVAWDIDAIAQAWLELVRTVPWQTLGEPMPVLRRTTLALAVDTAIALTALPQAFSSGWFPWPGNPKTGETGDAAVVAYEASVVETIASRRDLVTFVQPVAAAWHRFVVANEEAFGENPARPVRTPRGGLTWIALLEAQRLHAAQHYRQAATQLAALGHSAPPLDFDAMYGLRLPQSIY
jgi:hypothetical protein